ncbi:MAG: HAD family hydrolase [Planctomycetota bacterium]|jgi:pyrophosphatase PpaX
MRAEAVVLFDLDGTVLDTESRIKIAWDQTLAAHGRPPCTDWVPVFSSTLEGLLQVTSEEPAERRSMRAAYADHYRALLTTPEVAYPGVAETVETLRGEGVRTAVVTSKGRKGSLRGLRQVGLLGHMELLVCAEDVRLHKPDPEPVRQAIQRLEARPENTMFVGDTPSDMQSGRAAGVRTGAALWGPGEKSFLSCAEPDHWLEQPAQILDLVPR